MGVPEEFSKKTNWNFGMEYQYGGMTDMILVGDYKRKLSEVGFLFHY
jgi:hypothetical protein